MKETQSVRRKLVYGIVSVKQTPTPMIRELALHARRTGRRLLAYQPGDLNAVLTRNRKRVWVHEFNLKSQTWIRKMGPVPDVILRDYRNSDTHADEKMAMQHLMVYVNPLTPVQIVKDKAQFSALMKQGGLPHPETIPYTPESLNAFLNEHGAVYVKDRKGSKGIGILRIEDTEDDMAKIQFKNLGKWIDQSVPKSQLGETLEKIIRDCPQSDPTQYVVQREVKTPTLDGKKFSVRIIMHRTEDGHVISGGFAAIGEVGSIVSNLSQGGQLVPYSKALRKAYGADYSKVRDQLVHVCRKAFRLVEKESRLHSSLPMGELGFDIVFEGKNPVVLEANSRPAVISTHPHLKKYMENLFLAGQHVYKEATRRRR